MTEIQQLALGWMEVLVNLLPVSYAFGAGMVSTVNPCGFAMLPAYLSLYLGARDGTFYQRSVGLRTLKALFVGLTASAGFVAVFATVGAGVSAGGRFLIAVMPWIAVVIGAGLVALGLAMLAGHTPSAASFVRAAGRIGGPGSPGVVGFFVFGVAFAAASLSCTLPIFLMVLGSALTSGGFLAGLTQFISYGLGMGLVLTALTLGVALFKEGVVVSGLRGVLPYMQRAAAVLVLLSGTYILYYWLLKGGLISRLI